MIFLVNAETGENSQWAMKRVADICQNDFASQLFVLFATDKMSSFFPAESTAQMLAGAHLSLVGREIDQELILPDKCGAGKRRELHRHLFRRLLGTHGADLLVCTDARSIRSLLYRICHRRYRSSLPAGTVVTIDMSEFAMYKPE